ncbi:MAG TPA: 3-hydroxyisobutyrate dehydrogenase [Chloroflexus aurantiacus]|uniref:3-hydroxyisobutyrate dehydrogenase-like protein n=1 Tax=Chloroflexus aurantiacus (strain ATCC 29366 / DSM 635 / J-10-fl) TaxID=324602 RepID=A9WB30_CHLAA|nr:MULTISPECIES: NAD(P)-binding domain-containing protein [Chloroflexus]ABY36823.1 3-hydroxyisobutyrate dehydrogenase-like protein [Chloroflexus aurantiacus J-10-fl]RMG49293.1 MAG: 3-hydroxyisobutyrate dehydrogenase [Chloroflexota bacterium]HBW66600.1 3-hydroxyisobutyrate dehydrogenase [Chloroflexus aurantiacus]
MTPQVGFVGLGIMGKPMAHNLHRAGFSVMVWNRSRQPMDELPAEGLHSAESPPALCIRQTRAHPRSTDDPQRYLR